MFSVLIPAYKTKYLKQAIDSVLNQTFTDFELIIVNDKSPEDVDSIVKSYSDSRISYYVNENNLGGVNVVGNWNKCFSYATKPYSILFSDDDVLDHAFLETISKLIGKHPLVNVFYSRVGVIDSDNNILKLTSSSPEKESALDFVWHRVYGFRDIFAQNFVFKSQKLKELGGFVNFPLAWGTDDATWFWLAEENGVVATNEVLCFWRWSELNISNVGSINVRVDAVIKYCNWLQSFTKKCKGVNDNDEILRQAILERLPKRKIDSLKNLIDLLFKNVKYVKALKIFNDLSKQYNDITYKLLVLAIGKKIVRRNG